MTKSLSLAIVFAILAWVLTLNMAHANGCIEDVKRNALYARATFECGADYLDTRAGLDAITGAKECKSMSDTQLTTVTKKAMIDFDTMVRLVGLHQACSAVDRIQRCMSTGESCGS